MEALIQLAQKSQIFQYLSGILLILVVGQPTIETAYETRPINTADINVFVKRSF